MVCSNMYQAAHELCMTMPTLLPGLLTSRPAQEDGLVLSVISFREGSAALATGQGIYHPKIR